MEDLPDQLIWEILRHIWSTVDQNAASLVCKRLYRTDNEQRCSLWFGCGDPANEALSTLCARFPNLAKIKITYAGWMSKLGKQLDDQASCSSFPNSALL
ncbi:hypothetical protein MLD38_029667 [Melastoma candidum]|uniref:Uncharacterized protein n=1 Tax=Melastoma candidum TaxID=119954 RepID=A0ACB9N4S8_9MYRT|nr:hypothetical protein MLD38_029667 [Melastoma candidum]